MWDVLLFLRGLVRAGWCASSIPDSWSDWIDWLESAPSGGRWMGRDWIESGRTTATEDGYAQPSPSNQRSNQGLMPFIDMVKRVALETAVSRQVTATDTCQHTYVICVRAKSPGSPGQVVYHKISSNEGSFIQ